MPSCPTCHEQRSGLFCPADGAALSYRQSVEDMRSLPKVEPDYGKISIITVGCPGLSLDADYLGEVSVGQADLRTSTSFQVASIRGGSWLDFQSKCLEELRRWFRLVGVDKSTDRLLVVDTTSPLSVLALSALPKIERTAVIAVAADQDSTPLEQNTSYVALSLASKKDLPVIALSETFEKEMLYFTEDEGFATDADAMSRLINALLAAADDVMDLLERDLKLGVKMHSLSAIMAGSASVYGTVTNAFTAETYSVSNGAKPAEYQTIHSLAFSPKETRGEFEKSFDVFRNKKFKGALSAELRFHETASPLYDLVTIYGVGNEDFLRGIAGGYQAIVNSVPALNLDGAS